MKSAMVLMGENRSALSVTRALGELGIPVYVGSSRFLSRSAFSKYCKKSFIYASPHKNSPEREHMGILRYVKKLRPDVLFPISSYTSDIVLKHAAEYKKYCKVIANLGFDKFNRFEDKAFQMKTARKFGYGIPKTYFPKNIEEVKKISKKIRHPVLIKPRRSTMGVGIIEVSDPKQLVSEYKKSISQRKNYWFDPTYPIIQELIEGQKFFIYGVFNKGKPIANVFMNNFRIYPKWGNPMITISAENKRVVNRTVSLMKKIRWHGPFCLQGAIDKKDRKEKLFEINPRLGGTVGGAIASGINIPLILFRMALGEKVKEVKNYKKGQKYRTMQFGELAYFFQSKNKFPTFKEYFSFENTMTDISFKDPLPNIIRFIDLVVNRAIL